MFCHNAGMTLTLKLVELLFEASAAGMELTTCRNVQRGRLIGRLIDQLANLALASGNCEGNRSRRKGSLEDYAHCSGSPTDDRTTHRPKDYNYNLCTHTRRNGVATIGKYKKLVYSVTAMCRSWQSDRALF